MKMKICKSPGCNDLIDFSQSYCERHIPEKRIPFMTAERSNESLYSTSKWKKLRKKILSEYNYCFKCGLESKLLDIHHEIPPRGNEELFYDENNCIPVCKSCHRILTAYEIKNRN